MAAILEKTYKLKSGYEMPALGLGTWDLNGPTCEKVVKKAVELGYKQIDTAEMYKNESEIGKAIKGLDRASLFITSKIDSSHLKKNDVIQTCKKSLQRLGADYLDLYLIHWPNDDIPIAETMAGMQQLVEDSLVRSIGLSNFNVARAKEAISVCDVPICNIQVEYHPLTKRKELPDFCEQEGIILTAYCPIARGKVFSYETITKIGQKYGKSAAQVSLKWLLQKGHVVIPKSASDDHLKANIELGDFELSQDDMKAIDNIEAQERLVDSQYT